MVYLLLVMAMKLCKAGTAMRARMGVILAVFLHKLFREDRTMENGGA
jgi:hypothetical protein